MKSGETGDSVEGAAARSVNPYETLPSKAFWSPAVAKRNMFDIAELWAPKFRIDPKMPVATFGSCFAQHIGRALKERGFHWMIAEQRPYRMSDVSAKKFNYGVFSARTGNIYTASLLKQWVSWALGASAPEEIWEKDGRFYDPFRPNIEPNGFASAEELRKSRDMALQAFRRTLTDSRVFVFTLGLTESWFNEAHGYEYPMCPGTVAGEFNPAVHKFVNQEYSFIRTTLAETIKTIKSVNPRIKIILTVSPVPLTATMSGNHVLVATMESKSILRAVAGSVSRRYAFVDYFPSYEIINATPYRGAFFEPNARSVNHVGVAHVMNMFFNCLREAFPGIDATASADAKAKGKTGRKSAAASGAKSPEATAGDAGTQGLPAPREVGGEAKSRSDIVCEEELLNAFAR
ncbi:MAG: GSCFA domain-containing protein [Chitinophagaceae bacterium]|nr:GSCFA domain-containing protein [Chitinophagaceae bacterium]